MANEKTLKTRIINKHDTTINWNKATNFIPKKGEIVIYDDNNGKLKIGDGVNSVIKLPFILSPAVDEALSKAQASGMFKGDQGEKGDVGNPGKNGISVTHSWSGTTLNITSASGTSSVNLIGPRGATGANGHTPVKGVDYFTTAEVNSVASQAAGLIGIATASKNGLLSSSDKIKLDKALLSGSTIQGGTW